MHENTPPCWKNKAWLSSVWLYVLCLLTPVIFVIFGYGAVGVQFKCRFHYSYSKLFDLLANSIKQGSPGLASPKAERRAMEKETGKVEVGAAVKRLPHGMMPDCEGSKRGGEVGSPVPCIPPALPVLLLLWSHFPCYIIKEAKSSAKGEGKQWAENRGLGADF